MKAGCAIMLGVLCLGWTAAGLASAPTLPPAAAAAAAQPEDDAIAAAALRQLGDRLGVDVTIDGAGPYRFMVDSGASRTVVSRRLADLLKLVPDADVDLHSMGGEARVATVRLPGLELGGMRTDAINAPVLDEANLGSPAILGIDALNGRRVTIDMAARVMTIRASTPRIERAAPGEIVVIARRRYGQLILTQATIDGLRVDAVIDSGSDVTIGNAALERRLSVRRRNAAQSVALLDVIGRTTVARLAPLTEMKIGALTLTNVPVAFADTHAFAQFGMIKRPALLIGMDVLRAFRRVSIDFASRSIRFLVDERGVRTRVASAR